MKRVGSAIIVIGLAFGQLVSSVPVFASDEFPPDTIDQPEISEIIQGAKPPTNQPTPDIDITADAKTNAEVDKQNIPAVETQPQVQSDVDVPDKQVDDPPKSPQASDLLISKVQVGDESNSSNEFIEIHNPAEEDVFLEGWELYYYKKDGSSTQKIADLDDINISANGFYVIKNKVYSNLTDFDAEFDSKTPKNTLAQDGTVELRHHKQMADLVGWGEANKYLEAAATGVKHGAIERCANSAGKVIDTRSNKADFAQYNWPSKPMVRQVADCAQATDPVDDADGTPANKCEGLIITEIAANVDEQFVEIYNITKKPIDLHGCQLSSNYYKNSSYKFNNIEISPHEYEVAYLSGTELKIVKGSSDKVYLRSADGKTDQDSRGYSNLKVGTSWALINDSWKQTYTMTPGKANTYTQFKPCQPGYQRHQQTNSCRKIVADSELKPCAPDQERNPVTKRCRKIQTTTSSLKPCLPGQVRNPETNRCRKVGTTAGGLVPCKPGQVRNPETNRCRSAISAVGGLKPCAPGQERNPETNRCRKIGSTVKALKPCASGYERNPETNRCRKVRSSIGEVAGYAVEPVADSAQSTIGWWAFGGVGVLAAGYATWEWRSEISRIIRSVIFRR